MGCRALEISVSRLRGLGPRLNVFRNPGPITPKYGGFIHREP